MPISELEYVNPPKGTALPTGSTVLMLVDKLEKAETENSMLQNDIRALERKLAEANELRRLILNACLEEVENCGDEYTRITSIGGYLAKYETESKRYNKNM
jgi:hypothetical protein